MIPTASPESRPLLAGDPPATAIPAKTVKNNVSLLWLVVLLVFALARGVLYTFVVPPWQHPDEPMHFEHIRLIAETRRLPNEYFVLVPVRREIASSMLRNGFWRGLEAPALDDESLADVNRLTLGVTTTSQPRLYYILAAVWLWPWLGASVDTQLYVVRLLAVLLNLIVVAAVYVTARVMFPPRLPQAIAAAGFVVFQPMHTDIMSAANNDALLNAEAALFFLTAAWIYARGWGWKPALAAGAALAAQVLTKSTGLVSLAAVPAGLLLYPWRRRGLVIVVSLGLMAVPALVLLGIALNPQPDTLLGQASAVLGRYMRIALPGTLQALVKPETRLTYVAAAVVVFRSFWAAFGWRHVVLAPAWYWAPALATLGALAGLAAQAARYLRRPSKSRESAGRAGYLLFAGVAVIFAFTAAVIRSQFRQGMGPYLSHGRYAFVAMAPFALLFTLGLLGWLPEAKQRWALWVFLALAAAFDAVAFWGYLVPFYYFPK